MISLESQTQTRGLPRARGARPGSENTQRLVACGKTHTENNPLVQFGMEGGREEGEREGGKAHEAGLVVHTASNPPFVQGRRL